MRYVRFDLGKKERFFSNTIEAGVMRAPKKCVVKYTHAHIHMYVFIVACFSVFCLLHYICIHLCRLLFSIDYLLIIMIVMISIYRHSIFPMRAHSKYAAHSVLFNRWIKNGKNRRSCVRVTVAAIRWKMAKCKRNRTMWKTCAHTPMRWLHYSSGVRKQMRGTAWHRAPTHIARTPPAFSSYSVPCVRGFGFFSMSHGNSISIHISVQSVCRYSWFSLSCTRQSFDLSANHTG